jgi:hypothetical protein
VKQFLQQVINVSIVGGYGLDEVIAGVASHYYVGILGQGYLGGHDRIVVLVPTHGDVKGDNRPDAGVGVRGKADEAADSLAVRRKSVARDDPF